MTGKMRDTNKIRRCDIVLQPQLADFHAVSFIFLTCICHGTQIQVIRVS